MVENTLGKLWLTYKPSSELRKHMRYYLEEPAGNAPVPLPAGISGITDITFLDPCMGSGHVLVYAFELFARIYEEEGYSPNEVPSLILMNNLFGTDIDGRAAQLAAFALTMKARSYHRRFFRGKVSQPQVMALEKISEDTIVQSVKLPITSNGKLRTEPADLDLYLFTQADNLGSLIQIAPEEVEAIWIQEGSIWQEQQEKVKLQAAYLSRKYHCVVTNPPYMGGGGMNERLVTWAKQNYPDSKSDLFAMFMERGFKFTYERGYLAMITMESWMFLSSYEVLRKKLIKNDICSLIHMPYLGKGGTSLGINFGTSATIFQNHFDVERIGSYNCIRYFETDDRGVPKEFPVKNERLNYIPNSVFEKIPGSPIGYWVSKEISDAFVENKLISSHFSVNPGIRTGKDAQFLKVWFEVSKSEIQFGLTEASQMEMKKKWFPLHKGGTFRKWYGNSEHIIDLYNDAVNIKTKSPDFRLRDKALYFKPFVSWSRISSGSVAFRFYPKGVLFSDAGPGIFAEENCFEVMSLLNSKLGNLFLNLINPTLNYQKQDIELVPYIPNNNTEIIKAVDSARKDWDSHETSWDFAKNELLRIKSNDHLDLEEAYDLYQTYWRNKFFQLHRHEEENNRQFIDIYGLQDELTPEVPLEEITILQDETTIQKGELVFKAEDVMAQFVSYAVGCMFGRYALDTPGLVLANQGETLQDYLHRVPTPTFRPDADNIIPILDDEWFEDDIVGRFHEFLKVSFGPTHFTQNLGFLEECLGKDLRRYFIRDFYNDHISRYKKRPIYWLFSSPQGSFNALIYLHRYTPDTLSQILNKYLREYQAKLRTRQEHLDRVEASGTAAEISKAVKEKAQLTKVLLELQEYEREILYPLAAERITLDLDDGVLVNYNKLGRAVKPVPGLNDAKTKKKVKEFDWIDATQIR